jgi:hypothetical protein
LDVGDAVVAPRQLQSQTVVARRIAAQAFEVRQGFGDDQLPDGGRARQGPHAVVDLEDQRVGEATDVVEALGRAVALPHRDAHLPERDAEPADERQQRDRGRQGGRAMPAHQPGHEIAERGSRATGRPVRCRVTSSASSFADA